MPTALGPSGSDTHPDWGWSKPLIKRNKLLLPEPLSPIKPMRDSVSSKLSLLKTVVLPRISVTASSFTPEGVVGEAEVGSFGIVIVGKQPAIIDKKWTLTPQ